MNVALTEDELNQTGHITLPYREWTTGVQVDHKTLGLLTFIGKTDSGEYYLFSQRKEDCERIVKEAIGG